MDGFMEFTRGPLFAATFLYMILGLLRHLFLQTLQVRDVFRKLQYREFPILKNLRAFVEWMVPIGHVYRNKPVMSTASIIFHTGLLIVPVLYLDHIDLWSRGIGLSWPGIPMAAADTLTVLTIAAAGMLFFYRLMDPTSRILSDAMDYILLAAVCLPFITGFMAVHPAWNPLSYQACMLLHILSAEILFVTLPNSKLVHAVLFPFDRLSSDIFWKLPVGAGEKVARELHKTEMKV